MFLFFCLFPQEVLAFANIVNIILFLMTKIVPVIVIISKVLVCNIIFFNSVVELIDVGNYQMISRSTQICVFLMFVSSL